MALSLTTGRRRSGIPPVPFPGVLSILGLLFLIGSPYPAVAIEPAKLTQGPVSVLYAPGEEGLAREIAGRAEVMHRRIRAELDLESEVPASILLLTEQFPTQTGRSPRATLKPWLAGVAFVDRQFIVIRLRKGQTPADHDDLLAHELAHVILQGDYPDLSSWPLWFQEGLAMRLSKGEGLRQRATLSLASLRGRLISLDDLWTAFPDNEPESRLAYAESFSVISFLIARYGQERFRSLMFELRTRDFEEALRGTYGFGTGAMEKKWRAWARKRYSWIPVVTGGTTFWLLMIAIFLVSIFVRRRRDRLIHERWEREETPTYDGEENYREKRSSSREGSTRFS